MAKKQKLELQIIDSNDNVVVTHHFFFEANADDKLHLSVGKGEYNLTHDGALTWEVKDNIE
jgi:hypothetical protein